MEFAKLLRHNWKSIARTSIFRSIAIHYSRLQGHYLAHSITLEGIRDEALTRSLAAAKVDMNPHQVDASIFALKTPIAKGVLLADEVGLGKTIEAGLIIAQRWAEQRRKILLIVPASLRKQWQQELAEKFTLDSTILEAATYRELHAKGHARPFDAVRGVIITSYEFAARQADQIAAVDWDLVVFDEAHRLRNVFKKAGSQRAKNLRDALKKPFKVLLTATPLQNTLMELYGIVSIIDDTHFGGEAAFKTLYAGKNTSPELLVELRERLSSICHRTLRRQVQEAGHINFTRREAITFNFEPSDDEVLLYNCVSDFLKRDDTIAYGSKANQLVVLQIRKILGSSTFSVSKYLEKLIARLKAKQPIDTDITDDLDAFSELVDEASEDMKADTKIAVDPEALRLEIEELDRYLALARSIDHNSKGEQLLLRLPQVLDAIVAKGGQRKAVIFTESVRTQTYLNEILSTNGYAGQTVLMNGSNSDPASRDLYNDWKARHAVTGERSGSRSADMKAAIVDAFMRPEKTILIATESGAEGINLQFCSLVINFDLPWNPQRIEQRIGRCHRYGQKIDVVVVNMLNLKNEAEQRIHHLLSAKFKLFEGVFGSSDEVLGAIESGVDFETTVLDIVQRSRTDAEIVREFDAFTLTLYDKIEADMQTARARILEHLDKDVVARLKSRKGALDESLDDFTRRLLMAARAELPGADFAAPDDHQFIFAGATYTTSWLTADKESWEFFRLADDTLASEMVARAKARDHSKEVVEVAFDPASYPFDGQLADVRNLSGRSGWMRVSRVRVDGRAALREELLLSCLSDDGSVVQQVTADHMLLSPSTLTGKSGAVPDAAGLEAVEERYLQEFAHGIRAQNERWLDDEEARLEKYASDISTEIDTKVADLEVEIKKLKRESRKPDVSLEDRVNVKRAIGLMDAQVDALIASKHQQKTATGREVTELLDEIADSLNSKPVVNHLFTMRWTIK